MKITVERSIVLLVFFTMLSTGRYGVVQAQQWPVQSQPVSSSVPQYRSPKANASNRLPLDFFDDASSLHVDRAKHPQSTSEAFRAAGETRTTSPPMVAPVKMPPQPAARSLRSQNSLPANPRVAMPQATKAESSGRMASAGAKTKSKQKELPVVDESIFRDKSTYPIDHRKPCWQCGQGRPCDSCLSLGNKGRPYKDKVYGGCECDSKKSCKHPNFSMHWPRPFSANLDARHPGRAAKRYDGCPDKYIVDVFNPLSKIKLSKYKRTDNGYCGNDSDPYGCLGESKLR